MCTIFCYRSLNGAAGSLPNCRSLARAQKCGHNQTCGHGRGMAPPRKSNNARPLARNQITQLAARRSSQGLQVHLYTVYSVYIVCVTCTALDTCIANILINACPSGAAASSDLPASFSAGAHDGRIESGRGWGRGPAIAQPATPR